MLNALLGRKIGMSQVFGPNGTVIPVTIIEAGPCVVTQVKTVDRDGYEKVQLGFEQQQIRRATRPQLGHLGHSLPLLKAQRKRLQVHQQQEGRTKSSSDSTEEQQEKNSVDEVKNTEQDGSTSTVKTDKQIQKLLRVQQNRQRRLGPILGPFRVVREVELQEGVTPDKVELGSLFDVSLFKEGEAVDIIGTSKGKGFQGVMKRHGFGGGPRTHGQSDRSRAPGSIGPGTTPGRVLKGTRMAGRMGNERKTIEKLKIVQVDPELNLLVVKGSVPGANGGLLMIKKHKMR